MVKTSKSSMARAIEKIYNVPPKPLDVKRILALSDLHLLHKRVPTWHLVNVTKTLILKAGNTLDAIYIAGDLFEDSRQLRQTDSQEAMGFLSWLLQHCKANDIALRVVEGTPSHDHGQSKVIVELNEAIGADALYLDGIGIFYDPAIQATVGWVQDEYKDRIAANTEAEMAELMATRGLEKVDFFFMHGCFTFQLPVESPRSFNESFWIPRTRLGIYIGHDHREKFFDLIRVTGSVDRLSQGEEEDKGMTLIDFTPTLARNYFLVNTEACPQRSVAASLDHEAQYAKCLAALEYIDTHVSSAIGRFKVEYYRDSPIEEHINRWKREYPFHIEGVRINTDEEEKALEAVFSTETVADERIGPDNVEAVMLNGLEGQQYDLEVVSDVIRSIA